MIDGAGVSTRTYANIATADAYGGDATVALSGGKLTGFVGASAFHQVSNAANVTPGLSINAVGWRLRTNGSYRFSKTADLQALVSYQPAMTVEQGRNARRTQFSVAGRKKLMDDQLNLTLRVIDRQHLERKHHDDRSALLSGLGPYASNSRPAARRELDVRQAAQGREERSRWWRHGHALRLIDCCAVPRCARARRPHQRRMQ